MTTAARVGGWLSKSRWRVYLLLLPLMVLPISFFAYSVGALLRQQAQQQAATESTQIARVSATLVEEHFRQSTAFLESIATRRKFLQSWKERNLDEVGWHLKQASGLRPDFAFVSIYDLDGTMRGVYPSHPDMLNKNFAYRDSYIGVARPKKPYISEGYQTAVSPHPLLLPTPAPLLHSPKP